LLKTLNWLGLANRLLRKNVLSRARLGSRPLLRMALGGLLRLLLELLLNWSRRGLLDWLLLRYSLLNWPLRRLLDWLLLRDGLLNNMLMGLMSKLLWCGLSWRLDTQAIGNGPRLLRLPIQSCSKLRMDLSGIYRSLLVHLCLISRHGRRCASSVACEERRR
jgi:hypothetical protein